MPEDDIDAMLAPAEEGKVYVRCTTNGQVKLNGKPRFRADTFWVTQVELQAYGDYLDVIQHPSDPELVEEASEEDSGDDAEA
jgi:hypothetical protein